MMYTYLIANKLLLISIAKYITNRAMIIYCYIAKLGTVTFFTKYLAPNCPVVVCIRLKTIQCVNNYWDILDFSIIIITKWVVVTKCKVF